MKLTYYGHACFGVEMKQKKLLFDPFITPNPQAAHLDITQITADYILISHAHGDHIADVMTIAQQSDSMLISNFEIVSWFSNQGIRRIHPFNHGGAKQFEFGKVKYVSAIHSSQFPDGTYGGNPGGFLVQNEEKSFYFAGDTALTMDMQLIPRFAKLDLAILPIGDNFTMGIEDAIIASDFVQCNKVLGVHYDTFPPIQIDKSAAIRAFKEAGKELILLDIGESMEF